MTQPLALVDEASENTWKAALAAAMPEETILAFRDMNSELRRLAEVAIVANPDPAHVAALPGIKWVHSLWAGVERLVAELGPGAPPIVRLTDPELSRVMAEAVLAWTYYLQRDMPAYRQSQQQGLWQPLEYRHPRDVTVGLLGLGALGAAAAARLRHAGFSVLGWSRSPKNLAYIETLSGEDGLSRLLAASDIVICLVSLTAETRGLLDASRLQLMKKDAALINFARGQVIVAADTLAQLDAGHISHAVLDVFDEEPLPRSPHPSGPIQRSVYCPIFPRLRTGRQPQLLLHKISARGETAATCPLRSA